MMESDQFQVFVEHSKNFIIAAVIIAFVCLEVWLINKVTKYIKGKIQRLSLKSISIQSIELISNDKLKLVFNWIISFFQLIIILLNIYLSLIYILSLFPQTKKVVNSLIDFIFIPLKETFFAVIDFLPQLFSIIITIVIFRYLVRIIKTFSIHLEKRTLTISGFKPYWARTTGRIVIFLLYTLMIILILPRIPGYDTLAFKGVAAFVGALVTLGGSSVIANYMAGIVTSYMHPCQVGDWIEVDGTIGEVQEMSQFAVKIKTPKKVIVSIPNTRMLASHIINYSGEDEKHRTLLHTSISIGYDIPWEQVNNLLLSAAEATEGVDQSVSPFVMQIKLDDFYVVYELNIYTQDVRQMYKTYSDLHKNILDAFARAGVEILSPHYRSERDGNQNTVPVYKKGKDE